MLLRAEPVTKIPPVTVARPKTRQPTRRTGYPSGDSAAPKTSQKPPPLRKKTTPAKSHSIKVTPTSPPSRHAVTTCNKTRKTAPIPKLPILPLKPALPVSLITRLRQPIAKPMAVVPIWRKVRQTLRQTRTCTTLPSTRLCITEPAKPQTWPFDTLIPIRRTPLKPTITTLAWPPSNPVTVT